MREVSTELRSLVMHRGCGVQEFASNVLEEVVWLWKAARAGDALRRVRGVGGTAGARMFQVGEEILCVTCAQAAREGNGELLLALLRYRLFGLELRRLQLKAGKSLAEVARHSQVFSSALE